MPIKLPETVLRDRYNKLDAGYKLMFMTETPEDTARIGKAIGRAIQLSETFKRNGFVRFGLIGSQHIGKSTLSKGVSGEFHPLHEIERANNNQVLHDSPWGYIRHYDLEMRGRMDGSTLACVDTNFRKRNPLGVDLVEHAGKSIYDFDLGVSFNFGHDSSKDRHITLYMCEALRLDPKVKEALQAVNDLNVTEFFPQAA